MTGTPPSNPLHLMPAARAAVRRDAVIAALATGVLLLAVWGVVTHWHLRQMRDAAQEEARRVMNSGVIALEANIRRAAIVVDAIAGFAQTHDQHRGTQFLEEFRVNAARLEGSVAEVRAISIAPDGVIRYAHPEGVGARVLGHDLRSDPREETRTDVAHAIETGELVISGPHELLIGGRGLVLRRAVHDGAGTLMLVNVLLDPDLLFHGAGLYPGRIGAPAALFDHLDRLQWGAALAERDPRITTAVHLPGETWRFEIALEPFTEHTTETSGWLAATGLVAVALATWLTYLLYGRGRRLQFAVAERTREIAGYAGWLEQEIDGRVRVEADQQFQRRWLEFGRHLDRSILGADDPAQVADMALAGMLELLSCESAWVLVFDPEDSTVRMLAVRSGVPVEPAALAEEGEGWQERPCVAGTCDAEDCRVLPARFREQVCAGGRSFGATPLLVGGEALGCLGYTFAALPPPAARIDSVAQDFATGIAIAISQSRLREAVRLHQAELERQVADRTRELSETNAELRAFTHRVSHDLRAPLRAVQGFADALLQDCSEGLGEDGRRYAERIRGGSERLDELVRDLLEWSRVSQRELVLKEVPVADAVRRALTECEDRIQHSGATVAVEVGSVAVTAHRETLVRALINLIDNGVKFVAPGVPPRLRIRAAANGAAARISVQDNGIGIAADHQAKIFEVFERLHGIEEYPGTGIGLAIVQKAMVRMGGKAGVESRQGEGSTFWLELPVAARSE